MYTQQPKLILIMGGMFSQKTSYLAQKMEKESQRYSVIYYKLTISNFIKPKNILLLTHGGKVIEDNCWEISTKNLCQVYLSANTSTDIIFIDEIQFYNVEYIDLLRSLVEYDKKTVYVAGLDMDYTGREFETVAKLACYADEVIKLKAICAQCSDDATYSSRLEKIEVKDRFYEGDKESYEPLCRSCFRKLKKE